MTKVLEINAFHVALRLDYQMDIMRFEISASGPNAFWKKNSRNNTESLIFVLRRPSHLFLKIATNLAFIKQYNDRR